MAEDRDVVEKSPLIPEEKRRVLGLGRGEISSCAYQSFMLTAENPYSTKAICPFYGRISYYIFNTVEEQIDGAVAPATPLSFLVSLIEAVGQRTRTLEDHNCLPLLFVVTLKHSQLTLVVRVLATERYSQQISCESEIRR